MRPSLGRKACPKETFEGSVMWPWWQANPQARGRFRREAPRNVRFCLVFLKRYAS